MTWFPHCPRFFTIYFVGVSNRWRSIINMYLNSNISLNSLSKNVLSLAKNLLRLSLFQNTFQIIFTTIITSKNIHIKIHFCTEIFSRIFITT